MEQNSGDDMGGSSGQNWGKRKKTFRLHCQDIIPWLRTLHALLVAEKFLLLLEKNGQQTLSLQTLRHPTFITFFLEKEVWTSCSTELPNIFLSVAHS